MLDMFLAKVARAHCPVHCTRITQFTHPSRSDRSSTRPTCISALLERLVLYGPMSIRRGQGQMRRPTATMLQMRRPTATMLLFSYQHFWSENSFLLSHCHSK